MNYAIYMGLMAVSLLVVIWLGAIWFCKRVAKKTLHPVSPKKPLSAWPDQFALPYENVVFGTEDNVQLRGWFITAEEYSNKTIILMHDWGMNRSDLLKDTYFLRDLGFNLFYFDFRALGESGGKVSSIGYLEIKDIEAAVSFLRQTRPQFCAKIGLYGRSLGGMVAIYEAAHDTDVACVVAEGSFYSFERMASRWSWIGRRTPFFPLVSRYIRKQLGASAERFNPQYTIAKIAPRPILLIHGQYDNLVPAAHAKMLHKCAGEPKEIWLIPGAKHNQCAEVGGYEYKQRLADFYRKYL